MLKKILLILLAIFVVIQFIHPGKNRSEGPHEAYVGNVYHIPDDVKPILEKACNDCHSNNTKYPWYSYIQPVHWWLDNHIKEGKRELNFDEYTNRSLRYQYHKMEEVEEMINDDAMPLDSYTWMHSNAKLTSDEKNKIISWAVSVRKHLESKYPIDSLIRKKQP